MMIKCKNLKQNDINTFKYSFNILKTRKYTRQCCMQSYIHMVNEYFILRRTVLSGLLSDAYSYYTWSLWNSELLVTETHNLVASSIL